MTDVHLTNERTFCPEGRCGCCGVTQRCVHSALWRRGGAGGQGAHRHRAAVFYSIPTVFWLFADTCTFHGASYHGDGRYTRKGQKLNPLTSFIHNHQNSYVDKNHKWYIQLFCRSHCAFMSMECCHKHDISIVHASFCNGARFRQDTSHHTT